MIMSPEVNRNFSYSRVIGFDLLMFSVLMNSILGYVCVPQLWLGAGCVLRTDPSRHRLLAEVAWATGGLRFGVAVCTLTWYADKAPDIYLERATELFRRVKNSVSCGKSGWLF
mgnify:CR=1 FL=1